MSNLNREEEVWLAAYCAVLSRGSTTVLSYSMADDCLEQFKARFNKKFETVDVFSETFGPYEIVCEVHGKTGAHWVDTHKVCSKCVR